MIFRLENAQLDHLFAHEVIDEGVRNLNLDDISALKRAFALEVDIAYLVSDHIVTTNPDINSEIFEITKDWSEKDMRFLVEMLVCADKQLKTTKEE